MVATVLTTRTYKENDTAFRAAPVPSQQCRCSRYVEFINCLRTKRFTILNISARIVGYGDHSFM